MSVIEIRDIRRGDRDRIVALNGDVVQWTSPMDEDHLKTLLSLAAYRKALLVDSNVAGFLIAMANDCEYQNDNFNWFGSRYQKFLYIDRVVIGREYAGAGLGSQFYKDVIAFAEKNSYERIVCEYSFQPINTASRSFHAKMGFVEIGKRQPESKKELSMQLRAIGNV